MRSVSTSVFAVAPRTVVNSPLPSGTRCFGPAAIPGGSLGGSSVGPVPLRRTFAEVRFSAGASPAPGTYALRAGLAALGAAADRRRSRPR